MAEPRFQIRPLGLWGRPVTDPRAGSNRFRAAWDDTVRLLQFEVDQLDGGNVVLEVDADPSDIRRDGMLRARARVEFPGIRLWFSSRHGPLEYATDAYDHWQANVRAVALALQALRAVDRYGVTRTGEQYQGWTAITAAPAETALTQDEARRVLAEAAEVEPDTLRTAEAVNRAYRTAAKATHPDVIGGDGSVFRLVGAARDVLIGGTDG